jgi:thiaminase II
MIENILEAVFSDVGVDVVKTGMLTSGETIRTIVKSLKINHEDKQLVADPVMVSTSGAELLPPDAVDDYIQGLLPLATVLTPNLIEAKFILKSAGRSVPKITCLEDVKDMARAISGLGPKAVLIKGGHLGLDDDLKPTESSPKKIVDVLYDGNEFHLFEGPFLQSKSTHGTGCTLASAIASNLALGQCLTIATKNGIRYVQTAIAEAFPLGKGFGPVNHVHALAHRPFAAGHFAEYLLAHPKVAPIWKQYTRHEFLRQLGSNTLSVDVFRHFLIQDYVYLVHYARAHGLAAYKSKTMGDVTMSAGIILHIQHEMRLHKAYCSQFGVSTDDLEGAKESLACLAYSRFLLDIGNQEDWLALIIALSPCLFGYIQAAEWLYNDPKSVRVGNNYWRWVENYIADDYRQAVEVGRSK